MFKVWSWFVIWQWESDGDCQSHQVTCVTSKNLVVTNASWSTYLLGAYEICKRDLILIQLEIWLTNFQKYKQTYIFTLMTPDIRSVNVKCSLGPWIRDCFIADVPDGAINVHFNGLPSSYRAPDNHLGVTKNMGNCGSNWGFFFSQNFHAFITSWKSEDMRKE